MGLGGGLLDATTPLTPVWGTEKRQVGVDTDEFTELPNAVTETAAVVWIVARRIA